MTAVSDASIGRGGAVVAAPSRSAVKGICS